MASPTTAGAAFHALVKHRLADPTASLRRVFEAQDAIDKWLRSHPDDTLRTTRTGEETVITVGIRVFAIPPIRGPVTVLVTTSCVRDTERVYWQAD